MKPLNLNPQQFASLERRLQNLATTAEQDANNWQGNYKNTNDYAYFEGKAFAYNFALQLLREQAQ